MQVVRDVIQPEIALCRMCTVVKVGSFLRKDEKIREIEFVGVGVRMGLRVGRETLRKNREKEREMDGGDRMEGGKDKGNEIETKERDQKIENGRERRRGREREREIWGERAEEAAAAVAFYIFFALTLLKLAQ